MEHRGVGTHDGDGAIQAGGGKPPECAGERRELSWRHSGHRIGEQEVNNCDRTACSAPEVRPAVSLVCGRWAQMALVTNHGLLLGHL